MGWLKYKAVIRLITKIERKNSQLYRNETSNLTICHIIHITYRYMQTQEYIEIYKDYKNCKLI